MRLFDFSLSPVLFSRSQRGSIDTGILSSLDIVRFMWSDSILAANLKHFCSGTANIAPLNACGIIYSISFSSAHVAVCVQPFYVCIWSRCTLHQECVQSTIDSLTFAQVVVLKRINYLFFYTSTHGAEYLIWLFDIFKWWLLLVFIKCLRFTSFFFSFSAVLLRAFSFENVFSTTQLLRWDASFFESIRPVWEEHGSYVVSTENGVAFKLSRCLFTLYLCMKFNKKNSGHPRLNIIT